MKGLGPIVAIARCDLAVTLRDRTALLWLFLMPLVFMYAFGGIGMGGGSSGEKGTIPVVLSDEGFVGRAVVFAMEDTSWSTAIYVAGDSLLDKASAWVEIPTGLTDSVLGGGKGKIEVFTRGGGQRAEGYAWNVRKAAIQTLLNISEIPDSTLAALSPEEIEALHDSIAELPAPVELHSRNAANMVIPEGFKFSVPGNIVMFVLIVALTSGASDVAADMAGGRLRRLGSSPVTRFQVYAGKVSGRLLVALVQTAFLVTISTFALGMTWGGDRVAMALLLIMLAVTASTIGVFIGLIVGRPDVAANIGVIVTLAMSALGGCWWPLEIVSDTLKIVAKIFPTAWAVSAIHRLVTFGGNLHDIVPNLAILAGYSLIFALLGSRFLRFQK